MLNIKNVNKYYINGENRLHALKNVTFHINKGEFVSIMGSSGSGKSTLMNILGCLDREFEGEYMLDNSNIKNTLEKNLSKIRNKKIGFIFQAFNLLPRLNALNNVELPLVYAGIHKKEREEKATKYLNLVGLGDKLNNRPNELSGGQRQRVAVARALANEPAIILADEPTGNLDSISEKEIMELLKKLNEMGKTVIVVTHEPEVAKYTNRTLLFKDGVLISDGDRYAND